MIYILWYACPEGEDVDPFVAKYHEELQLCETSTRRSSRGKNKAPLNRDQIDISQTTVLSYNFELKTSREMYANTIKRVKAKLEDEREGL